MQGPRKQVSIVAAMPVGVKDTISYDRPFMKQVGSHESVTR